MLNSLEGKSFFLFPLQLSGDYQIRSHSPFPDMRAAASYVMESFARHAPEEAHLLIKAHPFDTSLFQLAFLCATVGRAGWGLGSAFTSSMAATSSSSPPTALGWFASTARRQPLRWPPAGPVCTLGEAIYKVPGLTFDRHLDEFWTDPVPPEPGLYGAFRRVLVDRCLVRGGIASESAVQTLIRSMLERLGC